MPSLCDIFKFICFWKFFLTKHRKWEYNYLLIYLEICAQRRWYMWNNISVKKYRLSTIAFEWNGLSPDLWVTGSLSLSCQYKGTSSSKTFLTVSLKNVFLSPFMMLIKKKKKKTIRDIL